ncbi:transmembrane protein [Heterostelium album PN500]|uniref:Transmembrane protein n=1 Tax=Heterostelium pallidum (strain ATCC 26659 / Pp 5 / PN500) TaxID=670386 RepID=D3BPW5_HETP5|nr:transmembrane protein [Heterostelium album PN500]EFA76248.1 transmembrane protein [Heterostelium album PN500]|eukprot:XP_020428381.1 transmembrane protein [Heterostelium album PN500]
MALKFPASLLPLSYGIITMTSFILTLVLAYYLHFERVTKTHCKLYEFLPSISSTIGDFSPEMNIYRYGMALTSGLRLATIYLNHHVALDDRAALLNLNNANSGAVAESMRKLAFLIPVSTVLDTLRVFAAGGWIYISSSEALFPHQVGFVSYVIFSFAFISSTDITLTATGHSLNSSPAATAPRHKRICSPSSGSVYSYFVDHTFYCVYLSYSKYSIFEWLLAFTNVGYDTLTYLEFEGLYFTLHKEKSF